MKFVLLRYYIVSLKGILFESSKSKEAIDTEKYNFIRQEFFNKVRLKTKSDKEYAIRIQSEIDDDTIFGKIGIKHYEEINRITGDDFKEELVENWPYLNFIAYFPRQLIILEYNSTIISDYNQLGSLLGLALRPISIKNGFDTTFNLITEKDIFWSAIKNAAKIYSLSFKLKSPNMFGADSNANQALSGIKDIFNNTKTDIKLINENGSLVIPKENIDTYIEYAEEGAGEWAVKIKYHEDEPKVILKNTKHPVKITIDVVPEEITQQIRKIVSQSLQKIKL